MEARMWISTSGLKLRCRLSATSLLWFSANEPSLNLTYFQRLSIISW